ncbi:response regulator [Zoogloea dura]|uniref:Response regulator n=1 Tax=Zoogloea dura TaxID=2728840 RepID=A0A848G0F8_9RHOO|nr:response regulator [Zoogloea dura]NML24545.1 response regulator [Zoogloea dura]
MSSSPSSTRKRVLVVDDNAINRRLAVAFVTRLGMSSEEAEDGPAALARLEAERFDIVLLDISMPGMSGEEVLARLRADVKFNGLRVIAYTAHALPEEKQSLVEAGFDDLLIKPINLKAVESVLADYLQS